MTIKNATVVIGAGYGDEGKGIFTQHFSKKSSQSIVIRFNGGAQAGHTVLTPDGKRHAFGHFTANSFLPNSRGYLSKHFIVNPILYLKEEKELNLMGYHPTMACHSLCYITTPYDMWINQFLEISRGNSSKHGSCGLGIGETVQRNEKTSVTFNIYDLMTLDDDQLIIKMKEIRSAFLIRIQDLNLVNFLENNKNIISDILILNFIEDLKNMKNSLLIGVDRLDHDFFKNSEIVFEGAQGLLLDQNMGDFPHVTRSNTGLKNVIDICIENKISSLNVLYATRCYKTRHGAGKLNHELQEKPYVNIVDEINIHNQFQGSLRFAYLDLDDLFDSINCDLLSVKNEVKDNNIKINKMLGISCLDQTEDVLYYKDGELNKILSRDFYTLFNNDYFVFECRSADGKDIRQKF